MSVNKLVEFNFNEDTVECSNSYPCTDHQYVFIPDNNNNVYNNGYINFNQLSLSGGDTTKFLDWSQAYLAIPWTATLTPLAATNPALVSLGNARTSIFQDKKNDGTLKQSVINSGALAPKSNAHIIDNVSITYSSVSINRNTPYHNLMMNEKLKQMNEDEYRLYGDILNYRKDSADSYTINSVLLETNNNIVNATNINGIKGTGDFGVLMNGLNSNFNAFSVNDGHLKRIIKNNSDYSNLGSKTDDLEQNATNFNQVFGSNTVTDTQQTGCVYSGTNLIQFQYMAIIPFKYLFSFFENMPSVATTQNFSLKLQTNIANNNFWQVLYNYTYGNAPENPVITATTRGGGGNQIDVTYTAPDPTVANYLTPISVIANQSIGHCCPVMLSNAESGMTVDKLNQSFISGQGFVLNAVSTVGTTPNVPTEGNCGVQINTYIGWYGQNATNTGINLSGGNLANACRIYIPQIVMTQEYTKLILAQPKFKLLYEDFYVDTSIQGKPGGSQVTQLFSANLSRPRKLYIFPYFNPATTFPYINKTYGGPSVGKLNGTNTTPAVSCLNTSVIPYQSPLSSAPSTVSLCKLNRVQINIGGNPIFMNPLQYNTEFYINHVLPLISKTNGNSLKSSMFSGQITQSDWEKCYGVYVFDLEKVADELQDNIAKSFTLNFTIDTLKSVVYDFIVMISYETELYLDRATGEITKG